MKTSLIVDISNIMYRNFHSLLKESEDILVGMTHMMALQSLNYLYKTYKPDVVVLAFDDFSWRKLYTENLENCKTYKKYKGNRRQNLSPSEQKKLERFDSHLEDFREFMRTKTGLVVLHRKYLEADDLIAGYVQGKPEYKHIVISNDNDFLQLLRLPNVSIIEPGTGKQKSLTEWNMDADYFMFEKCIRGDSGDNVISAYPKIRQTKIEQAYKDAYIRETIMKHSFDVEWIDSSTGDFCKKTLITEEVFKENETLMDLFKQPEHVKTMINNAIAKAESNVGTFDYFKFLKFCGKYQLKDIAKNSDKFTKMLSGKGFYD